MSKAKIDIQRIRLDAQGYDDNGAYYGAGDPVFLISLPDGHEQAIRARTRALARIEADALLAKRSTAAMVGMAVGEVAAAKTDTPKQTVGATSARIPSAASPRSVSGTTSGATGHASSHCSSMTYTTTWTHPLTHTTHTLRIRHTRNYLGQGQDHIEIESGKSHSPHPLSETGYRSEFVAATDLINADGPVSFVDGLIAKALRDKAWLTAENQKAQGDLFQWADAQGEIATRKTKPARPPRARRAAPSRHAAKPDGGT
jgi:hypothetical protein